MFEGQQRQAQDAKIHEIRSFPDVYSAVREGEKTFEIVESVDVSVGDQLHIREWDPRTCAFTGESALARVTFTQSAGPSLLQPGVTLCSFELLAKGALQTTAKPGSEAALLAGDPRIPGVDDPCPCCRGQIHKTPDQPPKTEPESKTTIELKPGLTHCRG
jgi:hypothetical protein